MPRRILVLLLSFAASLATAFQAGAAPTLLVASRDTNSVLEYDALTGAFLRTVVAAGAGGLDFPQDIILGPTGNLLVANGVGDNVLEFDEASGDFLGVFFDGVNGPTGLTYGRNGNLFLCLGAGDSVIEINPLTGEEIAVFVEPPPTGRFAFGDLTFGPSGDLYLSSGALDAVLRFDGLTGDPLGIFTGDSTLDGPTAICVDTITDHPTQHTW